MSTSLKLFLLFLSFATQSVARADFLGDLSNMSGSVGSSVGMGGLSGNAYLVEDISSSLSGLYGEIDPQAQTQQSNDSYMKNISKALQTYNEAGYSGMGLTNAVNDLNEEQSIASKIREMTSVIQNAKRIYSLANGLIAKDRNTATAPQTQNDTQLTRDATQGIYQEVKNIELQNKMAPVNAAAALQSISKAAEADLITNGAATTRTGKYFYFPSVSAQTQQSAVGISKTICNILIPAGLILFLMRLIFNQFSFRGLTSHGDALRDYFVVSMLFCAYPYMVGMILDLTSSFGSQVCEIAHGNNCSGAMYGVNSPNLDPIQNALDNYDRSNGDQDAQNALAAKGLQVDPLIDSFQKLSDQNGWGYWSKSIAIAILSLFVALKSMLKELVYAFAGFIFQFSTIILIAFAPVIIFLTEMLNFPIGWKIWMMGLIVLSLWPAFWNLSSYAADLIAQGAVQSSSWLDYFTGLIMSVLQLASPFFLWTLANKVSGGTAGAGAGAAATGTKMIATNAPTMAANTLSGNPIVPLPKSLSSKM